jgi:hypothetical protein
MAARRARAASTPYTPDRRARTDFCGGTRIKSPRFAAHTRYVICAEPRFSLIGDRREHALSTKFERGGWFRRSGGSKKLK